MPYLAKVGVIIDHEIGICHDEDEVVEWTRWLTRVSGRRLAMWRKVIDEPTGGLRNTFGSV